MQEKYVYYTLLYVIKKLYVVVLRYHFFASFRFCTRVYGIPTKFIFHEEIN